MLVYTIRRLLAAIPVLLAASMFVFLLVDISGDPVAELIFQAEATGEPLSEEAQQEIAARLYHDRPMAERYILWLTGWSPAGHNSDIGLLQGKFGPSTRGTAFNIGSDIADRLAMTVRLVGLATVLGIVLGIITGVLSAVRQYSKFDHIVTFIGFLSLSMPVFWFGVLIKEVGVNLNNALGIRFFKTIGSQSAVRHDFTTWDTFFDLAGHLILPTITLALVGYAVFSRFQRASMLEVLSSDYVRLARAKGLRNGTVMRKHALRTALIPVLTLVTIGIAGSIDGAVLTETVFQWQGLGRYFVDSLGRTDTFAVMGFLMLSGTLVVLANLIADLLYAVLDPRIRYD